MSWQGPGNGSGAAALTEEWMVSLTDGLVTKIERINKETNAREELSADEYALIAASYYAAYYAGVRDYAHAVAAGDVEVAQAYYQGMTQYLGALGQL
jgi:hypothetical protein